MLLTNEAFSGLQQWSEPLIYDRLSAAYGRLLTDGALAHRLARLHAPVWRALIAGDMPAFEALRAALAPALREAGLVGDHLAWVDAEIMTELIDVVDSRYTRSQRTATAYRLALAEVARRLRPAVRAAA
ncbi:hypothetical protein DFR50_11138 [Roseiarcus fermentans]|uniref:Uncharacterized protein n=1 Tax=Roseiarcus fermentans TaxID=1473586 RepID=A0A366FI20_9HYPH|nr:hypothetical protein [Roseiarcus fermentans]RBP13776.1 hypothetical protein DFR50_11138 [Roseiarcus fermentans]